MNPEVKAGQVWEDKDDRDIVTLVNPKNGGRSCQHRRFRIAAISGQKATVVNILTNRSTHISLRRLRYSFGCRGYALVEDAPDA